MSVLVSAPAIAVTYLIALDVIHATLGITLGLGAALLVLDGLGWWIVSSLFDRERPMTGIKS